MIVSWRKMLVSILMVVCVSSVAYSEEDDFRVIVGTLDDFSKNELVVSDRAFAVSGLVSCYDRSGGTFVGCSGITKARWVEVYINWKSNEVVKIIKINESDYKKAVGND